MSWEVLDVMNVRNAVIIGGIDCLELFLIKKPLNFLNGFIRLGSPSWQKLQLEFN